LLLAGAVRKRRRRGCRFDGQIPDGP